MKTASAWLTYSGTKAGLTAAQVWSLPIGMVKDQIACWQISAGMAKEGKIRKSGGSLFSQMQSLRG